MKRYICLVVIAGLSVACNATPAPVPTAVPSATSKPVVASATVAPPTDTPAPSPTVAPTATARPSHTPTATAVSTETPTPSATAPRPTAAPPTAASTATSVSARAVAPVFATTGIGAWDPADFRKEIGELLNNTQNYRTNLQSVLDGRIQSSCRALYTYTDELYFGQRGYSDVPDVWYPAYYEYRTLLTNAFVGLSPVAVSCPRGRDGFDAQYNAQEAALAIPALDVILSRVPQILNETAGLP